MSEETIKKAGLRVTAARLQVIEVLRNLGEHLSAEEVYQKVRAQGHDIGLATVYRVLCQLEQAQLILRHHFSDKEAVYEWHDGEHHDHLLCLKCEKITEFFDAELEAKQEAIADTHQFKLQRHSLVMFGICKECQVL